MPMYVSYYKNCIVPHCRNTITKTPNKLFVHVPYKEEMRRKWLTLANNTDAKSLSTTSRMYFCEDHFDMPNDMENYMQYKIMGMVKTVRMRKDCVPTKFDCQLKKKKASRKDGQWVKKKKANSDKITKLRNENEAEPESTAKKKSSKKHLIPLDTPLVSGPKSTGTEERLEDELLNKARKYIESCFRIKYTDYCNKTMVNCSVIGCKSRTEQNCEDITFHTFPKNDTATLRLWVRATGRRNWIPSKYSRLCSKHFEQNCFRKTLHRTYLIPSVPTLHIAQQMPLTPAERQKRYREKMKMENPDKYEECKKKVSESNKRYYREKVSQYTEEEKEKIRQHWRESKRKTSPAKKQRTLTPAEKQKKYREKLKMENPDKYEELKKRSVENSKRHYREKARQYTEEEKEKLRQHWRDSRRKTSPAGKQMPLTPAERQKRYRAKMKMDYPDKYKEYKKRIAEKSKLYYREKAKQHTGDEKEKKQQCRCARKLSSAEKQEICEKREIDNPDKYEQMMECAENPKCCNENTLPQTTKKEVNKQARKKLTSAERQRRYREKLKKENPNKYLQIKKNATDYSRQYYREKVSSNVEEQWNDVRRKRLSPAERMKRYREKLKRENPAKYVEHLKRSAENAKRYYRKKAEQYTEEEKEARRQKWREARRINKRKHKKRIINKKNTRKKSEESPSEQDAQSGLSEPPMTPPWHIPDCPGVSDTSAQDPLRKHTDQCRFCGELSNDCFVVSSHMPYLAGHKTTIALNDTSIHLDFNDGLPKAVCRYCDGKLQEICDFIKTVKDAQDSMHRKVKTEKEDMIDVVIKTEPESTDGDSISISDTVFVKTVSNKRKSDITKKTSDVTKKAKVTKPNVMVECDNEFVIDIKQETIDDDIESSRHSDVSSETVSIPDEFKCGDAYFCDPEEETIVTRVIKKENMGSETTITAMSALSSDTGSV